MINSYYKLKIIGKDPKSFIKRLYKMHIELLQITYRNNQVYILLDSINYERFIKVKTSYKYQIVKLYGKRNLLFKINYYKYILIAAVISFGIIMFLANMLFKLDIKTDDKDIKHIIQQELYLNNIKLYHFKTNFKQRQKIVYQILKKHKNKIEWLEIKSVGCKYEIEVEKRLINKKEASNTPQNIVARKNGIILKIDADKGEIVKKVNDYVQKGDIIISGSIYKKEDVMGEVKATGKVYAEVWYITKVHIPRDYTKKVLLNHHKYLLRINILNTELSLFNTYKFYQDKDIFSLNNKLLPFTITLTKRQEQKVIVNNLNNASLQKYALKLADNKMIKRLNPDEYIISKKNLKKQETSSIMSIEVFYKVYEDITATSKITPINPKE